ncbi:MAG: VOC family protein [Bacteroidota bacterium]
MAQLLENRAIDHIVLSVPNLEEGVRWLETLTGVTATFGGYHPTKGTKNALVNIGNQCYLGILTTDVENQSIEAPRWMGVDLIQSPTITRWSLKSTDLVQDSKILNTYQSDLGTIEGGQRKTSNGQVLAWEMIVPLAEPAVDILPFMTDWQQSDIHPTDSLPVQGELVHLKLSHPTPDTLQPVFDELNVDLVVEKAAIPTIHLVLETAKGRVMI